MYRTYWVLSEEQARRDGAVKWIETKKPKAVLLDDGEIFQQSPAPAVRGDSNLVTAVHPPRGTCANQQACVCTGVCTGDANRKPELLV